MLDRTQPPMANPVKALTLPTPRRYAIQPNLPLFTFPDTTQSVVQLDFIVPKGPMHTRLAMVLPHFLVKTMIYGTPSKNSKALAAHVDQYGASLETSAGADTLQLRLTTLDKHFHHLVELVAEILHHPTFPQEALHLEKKMMQQEIKLREATPEAIAKKKLAEQVFGQNHPYGYSTEAEDLALVTTTTLGEAFERQAWAAGCVILSGAVDEPMITAIQQAFATLAHVPFVPPVYATTPNLAPLTHRKKEATQASIALGMQTITRTHPDYPLLYIVNILFGGYFGSRLMQNIREKKGYTYGIGSRLAPLLHTGYLYIATEVKKGFAQKTCDEIGREIDTLHQQPVPVDELTTLKDFLRGHLLATFDNAFCLANHFAHLYFHGLDLDHYNNLYKTIQMITPADIQHIAQKYLDPTAFSQVIVNE